MNEIKVVIADNHSIVRHGLTRIIENENDISVVGQAGNYEDMLNLIKTTRPNIVVMDINMPFDKGFNTIQAIKEIDYNNKILIFTELKEKEHLVQALEKGADGYILKNSEPHVIIDGIRSITNGEPFVQKDMLNQLLKDFIKSKVSNYKKDDNYLTNREKEVLELIACGKNNKEIAKNLFVAEKTVKNHITNIFKKIKVTDRTQAVIYAYKHNIKNIDTIY